MSATTPKGYPYVQGTDPVADYPTTSQALATLLEAKVPAAVAAGSLLITAGALPAGSGYTAVVTFPVGRFTIAPIVLVTLGDGSAGGTTMLVPRNKAITPTSVTVGLYNASTVASGAYSLQVPWLAVQMLAAAAPGRALDAALATARATCSTPGCPNAGHQIDVGYDPAEPPDVVICGVCGQPITEVVGL